MHQGPALLVVNQTEFNTILQELRTGMSWREYANICELSEAAIEKYRNGTRKPSYRTLMKLTNSVPRESRNLYFNRLFRCCTMNYERKDKEKVSSEKIETDNKKHRKEPFRRMALRGLYGAICLQACVDYRKALDMPIGNKKREKTISECIEFFKSPMFVQMSGQKNLTYIIRCIAKTEPNEIKYIWRSTETHNRMHKQRDKDWNWDRQRDGRGRFAKNTRPIIEGVAHT